MIEDLQRFLFRNFTFFGLGFAWVNEKGYLASPLARSCRYHFVCENLCHQVQCFTTKLDICVMS